MTRTQILLFCAATVLLSLGLAAVIFPYAAVPDAVLQRAKTPQPMEELPDLDLGPGFGEVSVAELVGYYLDHPPSRNNCSAAPVRRPQFGGC